MHSFDFFYRGRLAKIHIQMHVRDFNSAMTKNRFFGELIYSFNISTQVDSVDLADSVANKVDSVANKVDSVANKVDLVDNKVDSVGKENNKDQEIKV